MPPLWPRPLGAEKEGEEAPQQVPPPPRSVIFQPRSYPLPLGEGIPNSTHLPQACT